MAAASSHRGSGDEGDTTCCCTMAEHMSDHSCLHFLCVQVLKLQKQKEAKAK